jgi:hypothetical protein
MFEACPEIHIDINVMMRCCRGACGTRENPDPDERPEGRVEGLPAGIIGERLGSTERGFPLTDGAGNPTEMQSDERGEKHNGSESLIFLRDELDSQLLNEGCVSAKCLRNPQ